MSGGRRIDSGPGSAVVEVASGRLSGFVADGVKTFLGIPYGETTGAGGRFLPSRPVRSWNGVRPAFVFGSSCPQPARDGAAARSPSYQEEGFLLQWRDQHQSEDCLTLNVWTQGLNDDGRRPVMVWLHGGHFAFGSGGELAATHGEELCRRGDVVVVSVNHRLNVFGYMPALPLGDEYRASGNAGMHDIVLALSWIRDNIAAFGGDPDCVTIFGQSGGGAKVTTLLAMPSASGLFHRAIVQSNCALRQCDAAQADRIRHAVLSEVGGAENAGALLDMSQSALVALGSRVMAKLALPINPARRNRRVRWEPVVDGVALDRHAYDPDAPELSRDIPLLVGTTLNEFVHGLGHPDPASETDQEVRAELVTSFGDAGEDIFYLFRNKYPTISAFELKSRAYGATIREWAVIQARRKCKQKPASSYLYWFRWATPALGGRPGAFHSSELPFVFNTARRCPEWTTGSEEAATLAERMSDAWLNFARSGNPNHSGIPRWQPVTETGSETMCFNETITFDPGSDEDERSLTGAA